MKICTRYNKDCEEALKFKCDIPLTFSNNVGATLCDVCIFCEDNIKEDNIK